MGKPVIQIEGVGKRYQLGTADGIPYKTLRDFIPSSFKTLFSSQSKYFRSINFWALEEVSFSVNKGETIGIIGPNGAGKSTLLKILSRITEPTTGRIVLNGRVASLLEVGTGFHLELSGRDNIYLSGTLLGMSRQEIKQQFDEIVNFSGVENFIDTPVKHYSSGMRVRLGFAVAAHLRAEILLIDEVLAVGDASFQHKCLGKMGEVASEGRTILFVSHNLGAINNLCDKSVLIQNGRIKEFGETSSIINAYLQQKSKHKIIFKNKPLQVLQVEQINETISIFAEYHVDQRVILPSLGFVIYNQLGHPVCGGNPILLGKSDFTREYSQKGSIQITVKEPKLLDGYYSFSFWFGIDGKQDIQIERDCIRLYINNMKILHGKFSIKDLGNAGVVCDYEFS